MILPDAFLRIGHRGRPGEPRFGENTLLSFRKAVLLGANAIEYDLRRTRDGKIVVIHDATVDRTTNGKGAVSDLSYDELLELDAGFGEPIPLWRDVLREFSWRNVFQNIELKEAGLSAEVLQIIREEGLEGSVIVSAFDAHDDPSGNDGTVLWDDLALFPKNKIPVALLAGEERIARMGEPWFIASAKERSSNAVNPSFQAITPSLVSLAHRSGLKVYVWTVNTPSEIERSKKCGVDGIFCDMMENLA